MIETVKYYAALSQGDDGKVQQLIQEALKAGELPDAVLKEGLISAMEQIGTKFAEGELYIPEVLIAAKAMHAGLSVLKPISSKYSGNKMGKVVIGTVRGDIHDIGKNLVAMMIEGGGFEVVDLGIDVSPEAFIEAIHKHQPHVLGMSALLSTTMGEMEIVIQAVEKAGLRNRVKTIVGGAPITEKYARDIGADGYAREAGSAGNLVKSLIGKSSQ
jgi:5-methyltetrahydrofolate--homocysteine methyltransferase